MTSFARASILAALLAIPVQSVFAEPSPTAAKLTEASAKLGGPADAEARKTLNELISGIKKGTPVWDEAATIHQAASAAYDLKQSDVAATLNARTVELDPKNPRYLAFQSRLRLESGDTHGARKSADAAMEADPKSMYALRASGLVHYQLQEFDKASEAFKAMGFVAPNDPLPSEILGQISAAQGLWAEAVTHLEAAAKLGSRWPELNYSLGKAYFKSGRHADARKTFERQLALAPEDQRILGGLVESCEALGDTKAREQYAEKLKALSGAAGSK